MTNDLAKTAFDFSADHPVDILRAMVELQPNEPCALVVVTGTVGGAVRDDGALMAVPLSRSPVGYVSNGCVDADVAAHARQALATGVPVKLRYGQGSPFMDIRLPCGGAIDLAVIPSPDPLVIAEAFQKLEAREPATIGFDTQSGEAQLCATDVTTGWSGRVFCAAYTPRIAIRIAGRGPEALAIAKLGEMAGFDITVQSPDEEVITAAQALCITTVALSDINTPPPMVDDPWTAFVMVFHDHDWETELLRQAVAGPAFYIGALGSQRTHAARLERLRQAGVSDVDCARIKGPIGLVPAQRNAAGLAISTLADVIAVHQTLT